MPLNKNTSGQEVSLYALNTTDSVAETGDAANLSSQISIDGAVSAAASGTITEDDAVDAPGFYELPLSQGETNGDLIIIESLSSTAEVSLDPIFIYTDGGPLVNSAGHIAVLAINKLTGERATGVAASISAQIELDGGGFNPSNDAAPTELDATNHAGVYLFTMLAAEFNCDRLIFNPVCSIDNVVLDPITIYPRAAAAGGGGAGGVRIIGQGGLVG